MTTKKYGFNRITDWRRARLGSEATAGWWLSTWLHKEWPGELETALMPLFHSQRLRCNWFEM
jgi:hypothetical protein